MNVLRLNDLLSGNADNIIKVLESMGFSEIREHRKSQGGYLAFPNIDGDNKGACNVYIDSLNYINHTRPKKGNLYTLVMDTKNISFPKALEYVAEVLKVDKNNLGETIRYPFNGFYRNIIRENEEPEYSMQTYDESILEEYAQNYSRMFFEDGIDYNSQQKFGVGYDIWSSRITIPEYTLDGKLCGIMGRLNERECAHEERWLPIIPCSRNLTLYGYINNYKKIKEKDICIIEEAEKGVMQMNSMHCDIGLATCSCDISNVQAKYIKSLNAAKTILAYDEGLDEEYIREQAKKLKFENQFYKNQVGYVYDREHDILKKGSKNSPSDMGRKGFVELLKKHVIWL